MAIVTDKPPARGPLSGRLVKQVIAEFSINPKGHHGVPHWMRVRANGLRLAAETGANTRVIELFALFHDSMRYNEYSDPEHGKRGALKAIQYRELGHYQATDAELELVYKACWGHTYEDVEDPCITVLTCWDADRLDLGRVGITPDPDRLSTAPAKRQETIDFALEQSRRWGEKYW